MRGSFSHKSIIRVIAIYCKIHKNQNGTVFAACDEEILGKTLKQGTIEFFVSEKFYKEEKVSEQELRKRLKSFDNINLIGNKAVQIAIEEQLLDEKSILYIEKIAHAQIFRI